MFRLNGEIMMDYITGDFYASNNVSYGTGDHRIALCKEATASVSKLTGHLLQL